MLETFIFNYCSSLAVLDSSPYYSTHCPSLEAVSWWNPDGKEGRGTFPGRVELLCKDRNPALSQVCETHTTAVVASSLTQHEWSKSLCSWVWPFPTVTRSYIGWQPENKRTVCLSNPRCGIFLKITLWDLRIKVFICCQKLNCKQTPTALFFANKTNCRTTVHCKCHRSILFFRKLYLFFFYKSTTGTKVKE